MSNNKEVAMISLYTREQALADGVLVDVSAPAQAVGFRWPVALTRAVWEDFITPAPQESQEGQRGNGRLRDILWRARFAAQANTADREAVLFQVLLRSEAQPKPVTLQLVLSFASPAGGPCLTILLPEED